MALLPVDEALEKMLAGCGPLRPETATLAEAGGRVLAAPLKAMRNQPPFDASAMDGYAVRAADTQTAGAVLEVIGAAPAGRRFDGTLGPGQTVRIFTGGPVPEGADAILIQENARVTGESRIEVLESVAEGRHIRSAGLDFREGAPVLDAGALLTPAALSLAAAAGHAALEVVSRPRVAVLATGNELVAPGTDPGPDQIVASNNFGVMAMVRDEGGLPLDFGIVPDDRKALGAALQRALDEGADVIVTLGGASVGEHDLVHEVTAGLGMSLDFWKIAMRPGKPLIFGRFGETRVLGLPGNPVSALVCAHIFLRPLLATLGGRAHAPDIRTVRLGAGMRANDQRRDYVRAKLEHEDGGPVAVPFETQDSSMLSVLAEADGLILREPHAPEARAGDMCRFMMLGRTKR